MRHLLEGLESRTFLSGSALLVSGVEVEVSERAPISMPLKARKVRPPSLQVGDYFGKMKIKMRKIKMLGQQDVMLRITSFDGTNVQGRFHDNILTATFGQYIPLAGTTAKKTFTLQGGEWGDAYGGSQRFGYNILIVAKAKGNKIVGTITVSLIDAPHMPAMSGKFKVSR